MMIHLSFHDVYLLEASSIVGRKEHMGPYGNYFDAWENDPYIGEKSFEAGEILLLKKSIESVLEKAHLSMEEIPLFFGGELSNQLGISSQVMKEVSSSSIGVYSACATSVLSLILCASFIQSKTIEKGLVFTSSSFAVAERQFRYPNDYGLQKKDSATMTVTGAASFILSKEKSTISITEATIGKVFDPELKNGNDLGSPMAYAAFETLEAHFAYFHQNSEDYDLILTGDLSSLGSQVLKNCFLKEEKELLHHMDAGESIFYREKEKMYAGGSGPGAIATMIAGYVVKEMKKGNLKKVLLVATGALFSPTTLQQKMNIPVVAHAITFERRKER